MADITYTPQFQAPTWKDNVDPILAEGSSGFNIQFQNLRTELDKLSGVVKQLSDLLNTISQTANNANTTANAASTTASSKPQPAKWGLIAGAGQILSGSGDFTVSTPPLNLKLFYYDIAFNSPFPSVPAVEVTIDWTRGNLGGYSYGGATLNGAAVNAVVVSVNQNGCRIFTGLLGNQSSWLGFSFLAYCPA